ncbi:site-specific integrase [Sphingobium phenoxybenzoativorans]|uniref:site-specific integrase n=1 Tax=Sphingobium phenoxybenzoativorans TaxID=1592790 RepID=UPI0008734927|nr:site-specific integrase [Sphingobium phenoxybenzoativorans]
MQTYLQRRGAVYYYRRIVPLDVQAALARQHWTFSLKCKDAGEANAKARLQAVEHDRLIADARTASSPDAAPKPVASMSRDEFEYLEAQSEFLSDEGFRLDMEAEELDDLLATRPDLAKRNAAEQQEQIATAVEAERNWRASLGRNQAVDKGGDAKPAKGKGVYLDTDIVDLWAAERKVTRKGKDTHRRVAEWFNARVGRMSVELITRKHVLTFKDKLLSEGQTAANINMKLSRLRTLLNWAFGNEYADSNAAANISIKDPDAGKKKRLSFTLPDLQTIFDSPVYSLGQRPVRGRGEAAYWLPLLGLYTGARLEELGQLRVSDVQHLNYAGDDGTMISGWFLHLTEDDADDDEDEGPKNKLKNAGSERLVPVHPEIQRLGFLEYVAKQGKAGRVFPELKPDIYDRLTAKWGEWFGPYLRKVCGIADRRKVFHSFRHTFKDYARKAMPEPVQRQIMGHAGKDVADGYGSGFDHHALAVAMAAYKVPGLRLPAPPQPRTQMQPQ